MDRSIVRWLCICRRSSGRHKTKHHFTTLTHCVRYLFVVLKYVQQSTLYHQHPKRPRMLQYRSRDLPAPRFYTQRWRAESCTVSHKTSCFEHQRSPSMFDMIRPQLCPRLGTGVRPSRVNAVVVIHHLLHCRECDWPKPHPLSTHI